jgi:hypothetical protein
MVCDMMLMAAAVAIWTFNVAIILLLVLNVGYAIYKERKK